MLAHCESCGEEIESADWLKLRGDYFHGTGSCRDLYMRARDRLIITAMHVTVNPFEIMKRNLERLEGGSDA